MTDIEATIAAYIAVAQQPKLSYLLTPEALAALTAEATTLRPIGAALRTANAAYRTYLENGFVEIRALERVADFVCDEAQREVERVTNGREDALSKSAISGVNALRAGHVLSRVVRLGKALTVSVARGTAALVKTLSEKVFGGAAQAAERLEDGAELYDGYLATEKSIEAQRVVLRSAVRKACNDLHEALEQMNGRLRTHVSAAFIDSLYPALSAKASKVADAEDDDSDDEPTPPAPSPG